MLQETQIKCTCMRNTVVLIAYLIDTRFNHVYVLLTKPWYSTGPHVSADFVQPKEDPSAVDKLGYIECMIASLRFGVSVRHIYMKTICTLKCSHPVPIL